MATARQRWTQLERRLWTAVRRGDLVDVRPEGTDPTHIWGPTRTVRAEVIRELLLSGPSPLPGQVGGLQLAGARVTGALDLSHGRLDQPFAFLECWFDEPIDLGATRTQAVFIQDCRVPGINADGLRTDGELNLDGLLCTAPLDIANAHISGPLVLNGARLSNPDGVALAADGTEFGNDVFCRRCHATGEVRLPGAQIKGDLDFSDATLACPGGVAVECDGVQVGGTLSVNGGTVLGEFATNDARVDRRIALVGAVLSNPGGDAFRGDSLHVGTGLFCRGGTVVTGAFRLPGARVGGILSFSGAVLSNPGEDALMATRLVVDGNAFFSDGFSAAGAMRLLGAHIHGQLNLNGATLDNPGAAALIADGVVVDTDIFAARCLVEGEMHMFGARVGGDVTLDGTVVRNDGDTLAAEGIEIGGSLHSRNGFSSTGQIQLSSARIGHQLSLRRATLANPDGPALQGTHLTIGHDFFADEDFAAHGGLDLTRCRVGGRIVLATENLDGEVSLSQVHADRLHLTGAARGPISLTDTTVRVLHHDPEDWPEAGFDLHGLTYSTLKPLDLPATRWLHWLRRGLPDGYRPQPYAQLATTLRNVGNDRDARVVLLARQRHRRHHLPLWSKPWGWLQDVAVGYGYVPWRAAGWLGMLWLAGWLYFRDQRPLPGGSTDYQPALYALDLLLPVLSLGQRGTVHFTGAAQIVAVAITVCSWILGIAVLAGLTRALTRN